MVLVASLGLLGGAAHLFGDCLMSRFALTIGPNGAATPATLGVPFEHVAIPSRGRKLDSYIVSAEPSCGDPPVLLIHHGSQETISEWVKAQNFLYQHCVSSVVFDPSGSGDSSRPASIECVGQDAVSAYRFIVSRFPHSRVYVLGHSLGNGVMLDEIPNFPGPPKGVIVANTYSSLRHQSTIRKHLLSRILVYVMPDWWNNVQAVKRIHIPCSSFKAIRIESIQLLVGRQYIRQQISLKLLFYSKGLVTMPFTKTLLMVGGLRCCLPSMRKRRLSISKCGSGLRIRTSKSHRVE